MTDPHLSSQIEKNSCIPCPSVSQQLSSHSQTNHLHKQGPIPSATPEVIPFSDLVIQGIRAAAKVHSNNTCSVEKLPDLGILST